MHEAVFKRGNIRIIEHLLSGRLTLTELSGEMKMSKPTLQQKYLRDLEDIGIVSKEIKRTKRGREASYALLPFSIHMSISPEPGFALSFISHSTIITDNLLVQQIEDGNFRDDIELFLEKVQEMEPDDRPGAIILFGSAAESKGREKSDIDILILKEEWKKEDEDEMMDLASEVSLSTKHSIKPVLMKKSSFIEGKGRLINEIRNNGIVLFLGRNEDGALWSLMRRYRNISL